MQRPLEGIRILEVAQYTFVPAAAAVLADWGADITKVEHAVNGDAQRGLVRVLGYDANRPGSSFAPIMEGPNRSKRSIGIDLANPESRTVLTELVRRSDVFLTNYLPGLRTKLGLTLEEIRAINPDIIYVTGSGFGSEGPDANSGSFDATGFWARGGSADGLMPPDTEHMAFMPAGAYGDNIGGMTIAGGIAAAIAGRERTGEPSVVDVSLLGVGAWATQFTVNLALFTGGPLPKVRKKSAAAGNPLTGSYRTSDNRWLQFSMLQPTKFWNEFVTALGLEHLAGDSRFQTMESITEHSEEITGWFADAIASRPYDEWTAVLTNLSGPWAPVQNSWELGHDESLVANGRIVEVTDADGVPQKLVANPVKFDNSPVQMTRAPQFAEHTDDILRELGFDDERLIELKIAGAVT
ncbi:CoA transferase [Rhodococcus sp. ACPA4]|uniref:Crotonobetainyl-CoA:carnitine CoA-transferase CaiB-like acyl-CoA transferase n=2 Tax=Nocardiaceae TaxID=85025 RepID=A0A652YHA9_NOCGL|nr:MULTISPECIES: CoA transferase [Rhodococcus]NMD64280.1 CoA transferase [Nocardia globerula]MCE4265768.1 CoA transferase [Rhodococcus globerulus]MDV6270534.1 CoA transferase [Rhodococcus globerulus]MDV8071050.1 CoA transferase [Rhodococcus sp. IEGM 1366]NRI69982.1 CoA transferase [Rhodococcus sp. MS16]